MKIRLTAVWSKKLFKGYELEKMAFPKIKIKLYILNKSTTSSVDTKLSISGWTCLSIYSLRSGNIVIGPI
jgi:hypothetical protein